MTGEEVGRVQTHLDDLDDELSSRLAQYVRTQTSVEPNTGPPSPVGLIVFEFSRQEDRDEDLENSSLYADDGNDTEHGVRDIPELEEPL